MLVVSWSFPPDSSIGALRWEKLVGHGVGRGWGADVIMMDPAEAEVRDDSRLAQLPDGTGLFGVPLPEHALLRSERRLRSLLSARTPRVAAADTAPRAAPGAKTMHRSGLLRAARKEYLAALHYARWLSWTRRAESLGDLLAQTYKYDVVVSSGPPHMAHEAARRIAAASHLPLVVDFRDPWTAGHAAPPDLSGVIWRRLSQRYERRCVDQARLVTVTTQAIESDLRAGYPQLGDRLVTIMNGADAEVRSQSPLATRFTIAQAGALYGGRDPRLLFRAAAGLVRARGLSPEQFRIHFIGDVAYNGRTLTDIAADEGIAGHLISEPARPRQEALQLLQSAHVLVLLPQELDHCIPGKTFEYVQFDSWVLAMTPPGSATELLLRGTSALVVAPDDLAAIEAALTRCYDAYARGERPVAINADGRFDRVRHADRLFDDLDSFISAGAAVPTASEGSLERSLP
jgi:glycosyltransferase involved in cell wall biosynthesis